MDVKPYPAGAFAQALQALMPPGLAWEWREADGLGWALLSCPAVELARVDALAVATLELALAAHAPVTVQWRLADYQAVAAGALSGAVVSTRRPFAVGQRVGSRVWSERARFVLVVAFNPQAGSAPALREALAAFKQAHMAIFYAPSTGAQSAELNDA